MLLIFPTSKANNPPDPKQVREAEMRPAVVTMSIGGGFSPAINDAVDRVHAEGGVAVVVSAGEGLRVTEEPPPYPILPHPLPPHLTPCFTLRVTVHVELIVCKFIRKKKL